MKTTANVFNQTIIILTPPRSADTNTHCKIINDFRNQTRYCFINISMSTNLQIIIVKKKLFFTLIFHLICYILKVDYIVIYCLKFKYK